MKRFSEFLLEARMAPLYHATELYGFGLIAAGNILKRGFERKQHIHAKDGKIISMTRNLTFAKNWGSVVLQFDQQRLTQRYKIVPYNFFGVPAEGKDARARHFPEKSSESPTSKRDFNFLNQFEESVLQDIKDPFRYVTKIYVHEGTYTSSYITFSNILEQIHKKYPNIKVELY